MHGLIAGALAWALGTTAAAWAAGAAAQDCPTGQTAAMGFVVERGEKSKSEVFHVNDTEVRTILRFGGTTLLETTQFQGLFELERIDRGRRTVFKTATELGRFFPPKVGQSVTASFEVVDAEKQSTRVILLSVKRMDQLDIGPCRYRVLVIDRSVGRDGGAPVFVEADYYSPDLKLVVAKEFKESDGRTSLNKFDRIYPIKR
jgi:hypothetical protein